MTLPFVRYLVDPSGTNPDNKVVGEIHTLQTTPIRAVATTYGPFFTESLAIYDHSNNRPLIKGTDYSVVEILQEATLRFGKEIAMLVLITNTAVSNSVRLDCQVLGGPYQNNAQGVVNMYNALMTDNRPVNFVSVLNKPPEYPPTLHRHFLEDIYGFEPLVVALERVRNAIVLSDVPAFEALIDWVKAYCKNLPTVPEADIDAMIPSNKLVSYERLLYALDKHNFNAVTVEPTTKTIKNGGVVEFLLSSTNMPDNSVLFWTIDHYGTDPLDFPLQGGLVNVNANRGSFNVFVNRQRGLVEQQESFKVQLRRNSIDGPVLLTTSFIRIKENKKSGTSIARMMLGCCINEANIKPSPRSLFIMGDH